jgi:hypothetical protein
MDVMCIFSFYVGGTFDKLGFVFGVSSLLPRFSEIIGIGLQLRIQELQRYILAMALKLSWFGKIDVSRRDLVHFESSHFNDRMDGLLVMEI